jgi:ATP-dependent 26S proteasome regulatory subunit
VVYVEDLDAMAGKIDVGSENDSLMLDFLDGLGKKSGDNIIMIATTNFPKRIPAGWLRPGRFDKLIQFGNFDYNTFKELFRVTCDPDRLGKINYRRLYRKTGGLPPAFLRQVIDDAMLMTDEKKLSTKDFLTSAESPSFRQHVELAARDDGLNVRRDSYRLLAKVLDDLARKMQHARYDD